MLANARKDHSSPLHKFFGVCHGVHLNDPLGTLLDWTTKSELQRLNKYLDEISVKVNLTT